MGVGPDIHDHLAELHVAGLFADAGWDIYFPRRDKGFDFIVGKYIAGKGYITRPVQVKGKYPELATKDRRYHGIRVELSQTHPEMVLAIPFFKAASSIVTCVAYALTSDLKPSTSKKGRKTHSCFPADLVNGVSTARKTHSALFDAAGLKRLEA